jgi:hypothetical protein
MFFLLVWFKFRTKILQKNEPTIFSKSQTKPANCNLSQTTSNYSFYIYDYNDKLNFTEMFDVHHYDSMSTMSVYSLRDKYIRDRAM